jgi:hypothetical protein
VLVCGAEDPLLPFVEQRQTLGFLEAYPNHPRLSPTLPMRPYGLRPLLRTVDAAARRHRYGVDVPPAGIVSLELGALHIERRRDSVPVWLSEDRLVVDGELAPGNGAADLRTGARWAAAPLAWRGEGPLMPRARAAARRSVQLVRSATRASVDEVARGAPAGYLWASDGPHRRALHVGIHPVTGDQLVTPWPREALDMGYQNVTRLGWASTVPFTSAVEPRPVDVPWASRFGRAVRRS